MNINNELVCITKFNQIATDDRGVTSSFIIPRAQMEFIYLTRKTNSIGGNTYHKGTQSGTNPKIFIFISGKIKFSYRKVNTDRVFEIIISEPCTIKVNNFVTHKVEVIEDAIFLECNSLEDLQQDRVRENV